MRVIDFQSNKRENIMHGRIVMGLLAGAAAAAFSLTAASAEMTMSAPKPAAMSKADRALIASAMSAAPKSIGKNATIITMDAAGKMRTLREGTNGFTCMPDEPSTPGPDPMCMDKNAWEWVGALMNHKTPAPG